MNKLTARQRQVLELIRDSLAERGFPPTRAELAKMLGFNSVNAAEVHIKALIRKGFLDLSPGVSRGIRLVQRDELREQGVPLVGRVAAGSPILGQEHIETYFHMVDGLFDPKPDYFLRVHGMSMRDAGILDGDLLAVYRTSEARSGQVVVARLQDEITVKRFERNGKRIRLLPENAEFSPIEVDLDRDFLVIEGIAVGVIRNGRL